MVMRKSVAGCRGGGIECRSVDRALHYNEIPIDIELVRTWRWLMHRSLLRRTAAGAGLLLVVCAACTQAPDPEPAGEALASRSSVVASVASSAAVDPSDLVDRSASQAPGVPVDLLPFREPSTAQLPA